MTEEHRLMTRHLVLSWHARQRGIDLSEAVRSAAGGIGRALNKQTETGFMMLVVTVEDRHEYRGVKKRLHRDESR